MKRIVLFSALALLFNSCDTRTGGCIELAAINYEAWADYDDGSCVYEADVVFYLDIAGALFFTHVEEIQWLDIYVEGVRVGTLDASLGFEYIPLCYPIDEDAVNFMLEWHNSLATTFTWTVEDEHDVVHYIGEDVIGANDCLPMELTFKKIQEYKDASK